MLGDVQVSLAFHRRWTSLESQELGAAYGAVVDKIREKNNDYRKEALASPAVGNYLAIEIGTPYKFDDKVEREELFRVMRRHLKLRRNLS